MGSSIARASVQITTDASLFGRGLTQATGFLNRFKSSILSMKGLVAGFGFEGLRRTITEGVGRLDDLSDAAKNLGVGANDLQRFRWGMQLAGIETDQADTMLQRFGATVSKAIVEGSGPVYDSLKKMGIGMSELTSGSATDALYRVADGIGRLGTREEKLAAISAIWGAKNTKLFGVIENGSGVLRQAADDSDRFLGAWSDRAIQTAEQAADSWDRVWAVLKRIGTEAAVSVAPIMTGLESLLPKPGMVRLWVEGIAGPIKMLMGFLSGEDPKALRNRLTADAIDAVIGAGFMGKDLRGTGGAGPKPKNIFDLISEADQERSAAKLEAMQKEGNKITEGLATPAEAYSATIKNLQDHLKGGTISQQTFTRAIAEANDTYTKAMQNTPQAKAWQDRMERGKQITESLRTPLETYRSTLTDLNSLYATGAINHDTYMRGVAEASRGATDSLVDQRDAWRDVNREAGQFADMTGLIMARPGSRPSDIAARAAIPAMARGGGGNAGQSMQEVTRLLAVIAQNTRLQGAVVV